MDVLLEGFFEKFLDLERNSLYASYRRKALVQYFSTLVEKHCGETHCDWEKACRDVIMSIIRFHQSCKNDNGGVCLMGKNHNILYVGVKLCFDWQFKDSGVVVALLDEIYECENTFERIWVGAIFGTKASHYIAGWKSDFPNQEENFRAAVFYLDHACTAGLEYFCKNKNKNQRFIDIPIECCGKTSPAKTLVQFAVPDKLHILLRFGALINTEEEEENATVVETILEKLNEYNRSRSYPYASVDCLKFILRAIPSIKIKWSSQEKTDKEGPNVQKDYILEHYPNLVEDEIIPKNQCGMEPPTLKHLCRCQIRHNLWLNYQLPAGTRMLPIPEILQRYLDLLF